MMKRKILSIVMILAVLLVNGCSILGNTYTGYIKDKDAEPMTNDVMDSVLDALNDKDVEKFVSLFSNRVRSENAEIEDMAEKVMDLYQGTGEITDNSYFGMDRHANRGTYAFFGSNLYTVETEVTTYRIAIGTFLTDAFDRDMEGLLYFQIWEEGMATGRLFREGIESDGGVFIYHCKKLEELEELEELPHLLIAEEDMISNSSLPSKRRSALDIAVKDAGIERYRIGTNVSYIDYYDGIPVSYNVEFESYDDMFYRYKFDLENIEIIDSESYAIKHPDYNK